MSATALPKPYDQLATLIVNGAPAEASRALRGVLLQRMLAHARTTAPFYAARISHTLLRGAPSPEEWQNLPLLTSDELRAHDRMIKVENPPPFAGATRSTWTSGSTGEPFNGHVSALADHLNALILQRFYRWWDFDGAKTLMHISSDREGYKDRPSVKTSQGWYPRDPRGRYHHLSLSSSLDAQLDAMVALKPAYLKAYGTQLGELARRAAERKLDVVLDIAISGGTPLAADERALVAQTLRCRVADIYGAEEIGIIATDCPRCGAYHAANETLLLESVGDDGKPAPAGTMARALVTPFHNFAMPLIRYEIGDFIQRDCNVAPCPNGAASFHRIVGRRKNLFTLEDGQRFLPYIALSEIARLGPIARFRVVQTDTKSAEFRYTLRGEGKIDTEILREICAKYLTPQLKVTAMPMPKSDNDPARKFLVWESRV